MATSIDVGLLGPLEVMRDGEIAQVAAPKQRALLAMLALAAPRVVALDVLMDQLWDGAAPRSAAATVQVYVSQLRKVLGATAIVTRRPGYALDVGEGSLDVAVFGERSTRAREQIAMGDLSVAAKTLEQALALWRGAALAEFVYESWASGPAQLLEEQRLVAREELVDAQLGLGRARDLVGELEGLVGDHPLRERLRGQLMLALYRSGRQADALEVYRDGRRALVEQLGIDPSPMLVELERRILQQDPTLGDVAGLSEHASMPSDETPHTPYAPSAAVTAPMAPRRERKVVSVLFCDMVDFTAASASRDPEDVDIALERYYATVRGEMERFGGTVEKFIGDAVMAVFGAPAAREDDPERAVRAALAIVGRIADDADLAGVQVRVAVTTGEVLVRLDPAGERGEAMVSGDVVNTASRLQAAASPGGVLVDAATFAATANVVRYEARQEITAKGKPNPIPAWPATAADRDARERGEQLIPLVGRSFEFGSLMHALDRIRVEDSAQLVSLIGVPGIGKSRLVAEMRQRVAADGQDVRWLQGRSLAYGEGVAFWALGEIVKGETGINEADSGEAAMAKLQGTVRALIADPDEAASVAAGLAPLVGIESSHSRGIAHEGVPAWRRFIEAMADQQPTVLVFEDLHWADDALLDFIDVVIDRVTSLPLLVVTTARPDLLQRRPEWAGGKLNVTALNISPLNSTETDELIGGFLASVPLPDDRRTAVIAQSEGNPLFVREYVRMLRDADSQGLGDGAGELPSTIHGLIAARLDALSPPDKRIAQIASVFGRISWLGALQAMSGESAENLDSVLHQLVQRQLMRRARRPAIPGETEFAFTHALIQDVAYRQIPRADRARYHEAAAAWIEQLSGDRDDRVELLGHHLLSAARLRARQGEIDGALAARACAALRTAGDRAMSLSAYTAAAKHYQAAVETSPDGNAPDAARAELGLGKALFQTGDTFPEPLERATRKLEQLGDVRGAAEAHSYWAAWFVNTNRAEEAYPHGLRACELLADQPDSPEKAYATLTVGRIGSELGDPECMEHIVAGAEMAERLGSIELQTRAAFMLAQERLDRDDVAGIPGIDETLKLARQLNTSTAVLSKFVIVSDLLALGEVAAACDLHAEARDQAEDLQLYTYSKGLEQQKTSLAFVTGDWASARTGAEQAPRTGDRTAFASGDVLGDETNIAIRAALNLTDGAIDEALIDAQRAVDVISAGTYEVPIVLALAAFVFAECSNTERSSHLINQWIDVLKRLRRVYPTSFGWPLLAWAAYRVGRREEIARHLDTPRVQTPWIHCARTVATREPKPAIAQLEAMGALGIARIITSAIAARASVAEQGG
jgi:DNA-binding SARP family transcriptional activator/class 3 adenylate cyclase/tetratricopeptide (TPR) repeat protein